jgi:hypothetical protein
MKRVDLIAPGVLLAFSSGAWARGATPYLPLNLEPQIEAQIERVLILADKPVMSRPIPAAMVLDALPKACASDAVLCQQVGRYLARYTHTSDLTHASLEGASTSGAHTTLPDRYGLGSNSVWAASASLYVQPSDYLIASAGVVAYDGRTDYTGSMLSLGFSLAQLDIGYRPHWLSPMTGSSLLMSTEAPTMPSITLSNYEPITRLGLRYEFFEARMSQSNRIATTSGYVSGHPLLFGVHLGVEPVSGWSFGINRLLQYGGDGRPHSLKDLFNGFFNPSKYDNTSASLGFNQQLGNQEASFTSSLLFPGKIPFAFYVEYAGEDTSRGRSYLLGNSALSVGIHFPRLWQRFDLTYEITEWQDGWYVHSVYQDGLTNYGHVVGNWFGDQRLFNDDTIGHSQMVRLGWDATFGGLVELQYRTSQNLNGLLPAFSRYSQYHRFEDLALTYSRPWHGSVLGGQVQIGRDVFGASFTRVAGFIRYDDPRGSLGRSLIDGLTGSGGPSADKRGELFADVGANIYRVRTDILNEDQRTTGPRHTGAHFAIGARRFVSDHNDLGMRVELDEIEGHNLVGVRLLDYRYRFRLPLAVTAFLGAARYDLATPAYGLYYGAGLQWRNILPGWDLGAEARFNDSIARDRALPSEPQGPRPDSFYDIWGGTLSISRHF